MTKLTNITDPKYRCTFGACPAVYRSEDWKTFVIIGEQVVSQIRDQAGPGEEVVEVSADLLLSSLGLDKLAEATEKTIADIALFSKSFEDGSASKDFCVEIENRLCNALALVSERTDAQ